VILFSYETWQESCNNCGAGAGAAGPGRGERRERALRGPASSAGQRQDLDGLRERRERKREKGWWEGIGGDARPLR
jgi:hypothetical protein